MAELTDQATQAFPDEVEVLALVDDRYMWGSLTVGEKRNRLVQAARGEYVAFVDDDDEVSPLYLTRLLRAIQQKPDVVTFPVEVTLDGGIPKMCYYSIDYPEQGESETEYRRWPNHLCVIRRELVLACPFPEQNFGEDTAFAEAIRPLLRKEVRIDGQPLYYYRFSSRHTATQPPSP